MKKSIASQCARFVLAKLRQAIRFRGHLKNLVVLLTIIGVTSAESVAQDCGTQGTENHLKNIPPALLTGNDGPYYIKFYPVILRHTDGSGGTNSGQVDEEFKKMEEAYKEHNIFFFKACLTEMHNTNYYLNPSSIPESEMADDGITGFMMNENYGGFSGMAGSIPSTHFWSNLNYPGNMAHEMGHCLGLNHTFENTTCSNWDLLRNELVNGNDCENRGDYICDTKATPDLSDGDAGDIVDCNYIPDANCTDQLGAQYVEADPKNIMNYVGACREYFSPGQGLYMRNTLTNNPILAAVQRNEFYIKGDPSYGFPVTMTQNMYSDVDIVVDGYGYLVIDGATLSVAPDRQILLKQGAFLELNDATLTVGAQDAECLSPFSQWAGIEIAGGPDNNAFHNYAQVIGHSSTIQDAKAALHFPSPDITNIVFHGRALMYDCLFRNNNNAINFVDHQIPQTGYLPSVFARCTLEVDQNFLEDDFFEHVILINVKSNIKFTSCIFKYAWPGTPSASAPRAGIFSYGSRTTIDDNDSQDGVQAKFEGFKTAVLNNVSPGQPSSMSVKNVEFANNNRSVHNRGSQSTFSVLSSKFDLPAGLTSDSYGIFNESGPGFIIRNNMFDSQFDVHTRGVYVVNSGSESNLISGNPSFNGLEYGVYAFAQNQNPGNKLEGLQFRCNNHTNNRLADFYVGPLSTVAQNQGSAESPTGNSFSFALAAGADFNNQNSNPSTNTINYFYDNQTPSQVPMNTINVTTIGKQIEAECNSETEDPDPDQEPLPQKEIRYFDLIADYDSAIAALANLTDPVEILDTRAFAGDRLMRAVATSNEAILILVQADDLDIPVRRTWLERKRSFESYIMAAGTFLEENDSAGHVTYRNSISTRMSLNVEQTEDLALYTAMTDLLLTARSEGRWDQDLTVNEVLTLDSIAGENDRMVCRYAKNICTVFYGYTYPEQDGTLEPRSLLTPEESNSLIVFPNPSDGTVCFKSEGLLSFEEISIFTADGRLMERADDLSGMRQYTMEIPHAGIHFYTILYENGTIDRGKIIIVEKG